MWNRIWSAREQPSRWPWSDVVSYVTHYMGSQRKLRVLELGCGAGANAEFFIDRGDQYFGVDSSSRALERWHPGVLPLVELAHADFTQEIPFAGPFDLVLDRAAMTYCDDPAIENTLRLVDSVLAPTGKVISIDFFSVIEPANLLGDETPACLGMKRLKALFERRFDLQAFDFKLSSSLLGERRVGTFNVVAAKRPV